MNVLSLCSGIGGLDLGLERAGMTVVGQVESDDYRRNVLAHHWPEAPQHDDVHTVVDWWAADERPRVDLVAAGFPCQPASDAGRRLGPADPRWLWPACYDAVLALRPRWVLWENVPGLLTRGLEHVHRDLVRAGYRHRVGWASACAVGAPHLRKRLFGLAHTAGEGRLPRWPVTGDGDLAAAQRLRPEPARSAQWAVEPGVRRVAYGRPDRVDRVTALGGAVVPQLAEYLGQLILAADQAA